MHHPIQVVCAIIIEKGQVLCAQRAENMPLPLKWEFPGGKIESGESAEDCLIREIKEELNLDISVSQRLKSNFHSYTGEKQIELIPFLANIEYGNLQLKEHKEVRWIPISGLDSLDWAAADVPIVRQISKDFKRE
ncbi:MAG: (deoxy)nucleoside triphosphate pyrophosphohydrolase [Cecembia sp.]